MYRLSYATASSDILFSVGKQENVELHRAVLSFNLVSFTGAAMYLQNAVEHFCEHFCPIWISFFEFSGKRNRVLKSPLKKNEIIPGTVIVHSALTTHAVDGFVQERSLSNTGSNFIHQRRLKFSYFALHVCICMEIFLIDWRNLHNVNKIKCIFVRSNINDTHLKTCQL